MSLFRKILAGIVYHYRDDSTDAEQRKVLIPFTKKNTTVRDEKKGVMTVFQEINTLYCPDDEIRKQIAEVERKKLPSPTPIKSLPRLTSIGSALHSIIRLKDKITFYNTANMCPSCPYNYTFSFSVVPLKGTVFDTLYKPTKRQSSVANLFQERKRQKVATSVPILPGVPTESHLDIQARAIVIDHRGGSGEVIEEPILEGKVSIRDYVKVLNELDVKVQITEGRKAARKTTFFHQVELRDRVRLTSR